MDFFFASELDIYTAHYQRVETSNVGVNNNERRILVLPNYEMSVQQGRMGELLVELLVFDPDVGC